jgi:murein DD-endopeptidase MepM/ murein hydrolase activator NlpD
MKYFLLAFLSIFSQLSSKSQFFPEKNYPKGYFRDPLNIPISLAGNFGELRPNHYHMGLDIKTNHRENLPVFAAADGYIAHVRVEPAGFGQAVYINHPNGYTTVYGHLNDFSPALSEYVKHQQYKQESWKVFLDIPSNLFPVKKGELIAYSGNTGGSEAPHVHFEIRSTQQDTNKNPMLFGMPIRDHTTPVILRLAFYDRTRGIYEQTPKILRTKRSGVVYGLGNRLIVVNYPQISFAISAFDTESGSSNKNGIYEADLYNNEDPVIGFQMDNISYENTRNVNAHIDYRVKTSGGGYLQSMFRLYGYENSIYHKVSGDGVIDLSDGREHSIKIKVSDPLGNATSLQFRVEFKGSRASTRQLPGKKFYPMMLDGSESVDCAFYIGERCLYDSVHINYQCTAVSGEGVVSKACTIGSPYIPLQDSFLVQLKANRPLSANEKSKTVMEESGQSARHVQKVDWKDQWASARFREFGNFQLVVDEEPPVIFAVGFSEGADLSKTAKIVFIVKDNMGSFKNFRGELDGKWLRFSNDKGKAFVYVFDENCPPGGHVIRISVEDEAGNVAVKDFHFTR